MPPERNKQKLNDIARYSGMAFEMAAIIAAGTFGGRYLDKKFSTEIPYFTIFLSLFAVIAALYLVIKSLLMKK